MIAVPLGDRVIIKEVDKSEKKTSGGILLPENSKEDRTGEVLKVGTGLFTQTGDKIPMTVKEGDTVLYRNGTGRTVTIDGEKYLLCRESDIEIVISNG